MRALFTIVVLLMTSGCASAMQNYRCYKMQGPIEMGKYKSRSDAEWDMRDFANKVHHDFNNFSWNYECYPYKVLEDRTR